MSKTKLNVLNCTSVRRKRSTKNGWTTQNCRNDIIVKRTDKLLVTPCNSNNSDWKTVIFKGGIKTNELIKEELTAVMGHLEVDHYLCNRFGNINCLNFRNRLCMPWSFDVPLIDDIFVKESFDVLR
ncbi:hypothetical protein DINM_000045 [Dirofilaria immitis]|nr:hypothetical protein [Dirofilaria immitis]